MIANQRMLTRLLTKTVWWWETKRPYPILEQIKNLRPIHVSNSPSCNLVVLTTPDKLLEAAWTSYSLLNQLHPELGLIIVVDQPAPVQEMAWLRKLLPNCQLISTGELVARARDRLPNCCRLADSHPLGRKLVMILELQTETALLYSDSDVLAFGPMDEISQAVASAANHPPLYLQDIDTVQLDSAAKRSVDALRLDVAPTMNTGFFFLPRHCFSHSIAESILVPMQEFGSWFTETTVIAALMHASGGEPLPRENYVVSTRRQFIGESDFDYNGMALRHFVSPVRHLMYKNGMPFLLRKWRSANSSWTPD